MSRGGVLAQLRAVVPERPLRPGEAYRVAERQAELLRQLRGITTPELPDEAIAELPYVEVIDLKGLQTSGTSKWSQGRWVIAINPEEPWQRQRFSMGHELWHIINDRTAERLCPPDRYLSTATKAERLADYFSGCLHMPRRYVRELVAASADVADLADTFGVSQAAVEVRLGQLGYATTGRRHGNQIVPASLAGADRSRRLGTRRQWAA